MLALCLAVLLLAQAGAPFTTGLWAKLQVVLAAVDANSVPLAVIAMVSAAMAAFFYLRVAVLMYSSASPGAVSPDADQGEEAEPNWAWALPPTGAAPEPRPPTPVWAGIDRSVAVIDGLNAELLLEVGPDETEPDETAESVPAVRVPVATAVAIGLCLASPWCSGSSRPRWSTWPIGPPCCSSPEPSPPVSRRR